MVHEAVKSPDGCRKQKVDIYYRFIGNHLGYTAKSVENSSQLFQALETSLPYGVFLDVHFPDENGLDILKRLKTEYPTLHVVMLTADTNEEVRSLATECGAEYFVYKPFSFEHLQAAIKEIL